MSNTCKDCESFRTIGFCTTRDNYTYEEDIACSEFEGNELYTRKTVFDQITTSPEVLALEFVYCEEVFPGWDTWCSLLLGNVGYRTKQEAIAATVARLKEPAQ